jgi:adenine phosphoribosyltransferase
MSDPAAPPASEITPLPFTGSTTLSTSKASIPAASARAQQEQSTHNPEGGNDGQKDGPPGSGVVPGRPSSPSELARSKLKLRNATRRFMDFPIKGIDFVDIMPLFSDAEVHSLLLDALTLQITSVVGAGTDGGRPDIDVIVGLDARGFLFGPGLALRLGVGFAPVRKKGKLPGPCVTASYEKEYGTDLFQMQADGVRKGQKVLIVDDIIATGGSAKAAAELVTQLGGTILGYLFILEIPGLDGRNKLGDVPISILLEDA